MSKYILTAHAAQIARANPNTLRSGALRRLRSQSPQTREWMEARIATAPLGAGTPASFFQAFLKAGYIVEVAK
jgi:hypothetical protein